MKRRYSRDQLHGLLLVALSCVIVIAFLLHVYRPEIRIGYEDAMLALVPSGDRAYQYANVHFEAGASAYYDIERAKYLYEQAIFLEPNHDAVQHQLARIAFLEGDFAQALAKINLQIQMHGESMPQSFYIRGLIEGYMGAYDQAAIDYEKYLTFDPNNWAAINDYAWVLLKADRPEEARDAIKRGLEIFPTNPWLLNSYAIASYEAGDLESALHASREARLYAKQITHDEWLVAYPGNDPAIADEGVAALRRSIEDNMHRIEAELSREEVQSGV